MAAIGCGCCGMRSVLVLDRAMRCYYPEVAPDGPLAQLGERSPYKREVAGSRPAGATTAQQHQVSTRCLHGPTVDLAGPSLKPVDELNPLSRLPSTVIASVRGTLTRRGALVRIR